MHRHKSRKSKVERTEVIRSAQTTSVNARALPVTLPETPWDEDDGDET